MLLPTQPTYLIDGIVAFFQLKSADSRIRPSGGRTPHVIRLPDLDSRRYAGLSDARTFGSWLLSALAQQNCAQKHQESANQIAESDGLNHLHWAYYRKKTCWRPG